MGHISHESNRKSKSPRWHVEFKNWWREYLLCLKVYLNISKYQLTKNEQTITTQGRKTAESPSASLWDKNPPKIRNKNSVGNGAEWHSTEHLGCISLKISESGNVKGSAGRVRTGLFSLSDAWLTLLCCLWSLVISRDLSWSLVISLSLSFLLEHESLCCEFKIFCLLSSSIEDISFAYSFQWLWMKLLEISLFRFSFEVDRLNQDTTSEHSFRLGSYFA